MRYLLITHIPFSRSGNNAKVDGLWARDLRATVAAIGPIRVAAPEIGKGRALDSWVAGLDELTASDGIEFAALPVLSSFRDGWKNWQLRSILRKEVQAADVVHTSNYFPPYTGLAYGHDLAVRLSRKTVFVIAEDFHDMLGWEWVRTAPDPMGRWRRQFTLDRLERRVRQSASTASLTLLHTPAAVERYRLWARNGVAIRFPAHESPDVISESELAARCSRIRESGHLVIAAACRHSALKGIDFLIRAVATLAEREVYVEARIFGAGALTQEWISLADRLRVSDRVRFPGALLAGDALYAELRQAHLFAMPHRTTDFGRAFFDALAAGLPVVAFRSLASEATVRHNEDGLLSPMDDFESLAASIHRYHADRNQLVGASLAARSRALANTATAWHRIRAMQIADLFPVGTPGDLRALDGRAVFAGGGSAAVSTGTGRA